MTTTGPTDSVAAGFADAVARWAARDDDERRLRAEYLAFVTERGASAFDRELGRVHVTASAFVLTADRRQILLCLHRKAGAWIQLGGHVERADASVQAAALREALEEGGVPDLLPVGDGPLDLDRHDLGAGFARCDTHWDVGYGFLAATAGPPVVSGESEAVRWWPVDRLPADVPAGFADRVRRAIRRWPSR